MSLIKFNRVDSPNGLKIINFEKAKLQRQKIMQSSFKPSNKTGQSSMVQDQSNLSITLTPKMNKPSEKEVRKILFINE